MHQNWFQISFLHWRVDAAVLQSRLPAGLIIDTFEDAAWVGLTPFQLTGLAPPVLPPIPWEAIVSLVRNAFIDDIVPGLITAGRDRG